MTLLWTRPLGRFFYGAILLLIGAPWEANLRMIAGDVLPRVRLRRLLHALHDAHGPRHQDRRRDDRLLHRGVLLPARARAVRRECALGTIGGAPPRRRPRSPSARARASASKASSAPLSGRRPAQRANSPATRAPSAASPPLPKSPLPP